MIDISKYKGAKLKDALNDISKETNEYLYVGARTAFFLVQRPKEALASLDSVSSYQVDQMKDRVSRLDEKIAGLRKPTRYSSPEARKEYDDKLLWFKQNKREIKKYISEFVPFGDRKIIDGYARSLDGYVIVVEGSEIGDYWLPYEFIEYFPKKSQKFQAV